MAYHSACWRYLIVLGVHGINAKSTLYFYIPHDYEAYLHKCVLFISVLNAPLLSILSLVYPNWKEKHDT
jgi:hypothetical protein